MLVTGKSGNFKYALQTAPSSIGTIAKVLSNIVSQPADPKYRKLRLANKRIQETVVDVDGGVELLQVAQHCCTADQVSCTASTSAFMRTGNMGATWLNLQSSCLPAEHVCVSLLLPSMSTMHCRCGLADTLPAKVDFSVIQEGVQSSTLPDADLKP